MLTSYSYTSLESYRSCPCQFKFAYIDKVATKPKVNADTYLGSAVHRVLRKLYTLGADSILLSLDDMVKAYHDEWNKLNRKLITVSSDYYTVDDYIRIGEEILTKHYEKNQPFNHGTLLGTELNLTYTIPGTQFKFKCRIDRLWKRDDGAVEICDYKTGQTLVQPRNPRFYYQMGLYQLAVQECYPQLENIELAQYFLRKDEVVKYKMETGEIDELIEEFKQMIIETLQATRLDNFPPREGVFCNYCNYFDICPAKKHRKLLDSEGKAESPKEFSPDKISKLADLYIEKNIENRKVKAELDNLKAEVIELAKLQGMTSFEGKQGKVRVRISKNEKFITKTLDAKAFADLTALSRQLKLDNYFILDPRGLMKDVYQKKRLPEEQLHKLQEYVHQKEESRVTVQLNHDIDNHEDIV